MSRLNKNLQSKKKKKRKKRHMYMFTLSQKTLETPLLEITKSIPHTPSHLAPTPHLSACASSAAS